MMKIQVLWYSLCELIFTAIIEIHDQLQFIEVRAASAKIAVTENVHDYLLGSKFHINTENNSLAYVRESKLGASQIQW